MLIIFPSRPKLIHRNKAGPTASETHLSYPESNDTNIWHKSELVPSMMEELLSIILALSDPDPGDPGDLFSNVR